MKTSARGSLGILLLTKTGAWAGLGGALAVAIVTLVSRGGTAWWIGAEAALLVGLGSAVVNLSIRCAAELKRSSAQSLELERIRDGLTRGNEHLVALHSFSRSIAKCDTVPQVCEAATSALVNNFSYDCSIFWIWNKEKKSFEGISASGSLPSVDQLPPELTAQGGTIDKMLAARRSVLLRSPANPDVVDNQEFVRLLTTLELFSVVVSPLIHEGEMLGALMAGYQSVQHMGTHDARVIESLLNTASDRIATGQLEQLDEKEQVVFSSVTNLTGDALARVMMFSSMERQIEHRAEQLRRTHDDLLKTREIIIQVEKLSSLGRMAAGVIHEINDPLNFLMNILPDLRRDFEGLAKVKDLAVRATRGTPAGARVAELMQTYDIDTHLDELDFVFDRAQDALGKSARIAHGLQVFAQGGKAIIHKCSLIDVVNQTLSLIPKKTKGDVVIDVQADPVFWDANADRMAQVCMNLIINALDVMEGHGKLIISGESTTQATIMRFRDTGPGIPLDIQRKIFDPFFTTKPAGKSTGLGLTICAEIVREYGGRFELESTPGKGTCFTIVFTEEQRKAFALHSDT